MDLPAQETSVCILLGVWGEKFIKDFLQLSLLSLLAPGNIPALVKNYKTKFIFLTRSHDINVFETDPAFQLLKAYCDIEFTSINDLIVIGNYSTTLTLAYDRAIKSTGERMLNTYFIFLTSDYIMADGSFEGLMRYMAKGYSGICAGNFQVVQESMEPFLLGHIDKQAGYMQIKPRELLRESFKHLHPITITSLFEGSKIHNYYANRFFIRENKNILAGKFYLLHMLCIKPETTDYQVGSSCDYSFIPEMCPSGNIAVITDSDDYLVVEIQSNDHELNFIRSGPYIIKKLVTMLSGWTTKQHRENITNTIFYHTGNLTHEQKQRISDKFTPFIDNISTKLNKYKAKPYRGHPYWIGAVDALNQHKSIIKDIDTCDYFDLTPLVYLSKFRRLFYTLFGMPPNVYPWHYRWLEYQTVTSILKKHMLHTQPDKTVVLYNSYHAPFMRYSNWFKNTMRVTHHYYTANLANSALTLAELRQTNPELCFLFTKFDHLSKIGKSIRLIKSILPSSTKIILCITNEKTYFPGFIFDFQREFAYNMGSIINTDYQIKDIAPVFDNFSLLGTMAVMRITESLDYSRTWRFLCYFLFGIPGTLLSFLRNCLRRKSPATSGLCTNLIVTLAQDQDLESETC